MASITVKRTQAPRSVSYPKKRYGMLPGGVIRKRLNEEEDLPDFWAGERRERFPLALRCRDGWANPLDYDEWLFGGSAVALIHAALPDLQILVDPAGAVTLKGLPQVNETWDIFDSGLKVNPLPATGKLPLSSFKPFSRSYVER